MLWLDRLYRRTVRCRGSGPLQGNHRIAVRLAPPSMWDLRRFRVLAFALFQCGVFAAAPAADALLDARESGTTAHVEGHDHCAPGHNHINPEHNHFHCQFTRALYLGAVHSRVLPHPRPVTYQEVVQPGETASAGSPVVSGGLGPRAPPTG